MHPLAAPGALWVLSRAGKVPRPPAGGRNLSQGTGFLWIARKRASLLFLFRRGFRLCGGDQRAFRSPFGNLRGPPLDADRVFYKKWISCGWQGKGPPCFFCFAGFRLCGGDQRAFRSPFGNLRGPPLDAEGFSTRNGFLVDSKEKGLLAFSVSQRISPLRRRPKGFPIALWKPSGPTS